jgi:hypothetical protein
VALLRHNSKRDFIQTHYFIRSEQQNELLKQMEIDQAVSKDATILRMKVQEAECFDSFEEALRTRSVVILESCGDAVFSKAAEGPK